MKNEELKMQNGGCGVGPGYPSDITGKTYWGQLFLCLKTVFWASKWAL
jgi:hypothetical protein